MSPIDIVILSNGPGEVTTWVKPVVRALRQQHPDPTWMRLSVVLSPCPNATGREGDIVRQFPEVDRVQDASAFWPFLLRGQTATAWDWRDRGGVLFLGGDQLYPILIGRRLGYKTIIYAEWFANWRRWGDAYGAMNQTLVDKTPTAFRHKFTVVGDLMSDTQLDAADWTQVAQPLGLTPTTELIGLLPGSKPAKLTQGVPLALAIADYVHRHRPQTRFVIPVAPTLSLETFLHYADSQQNPLVRTFDGPSIELISPAQPEALPYLKTAQGTTIFLWQPFPAHAVTRQCRLCITTVGANTAELGALGVPMIVLIPTQQIDAMNAWDGPIGLLINLPLLGKPLNKLVNGLLWAYLRRRQKRFAWPNIWAQREIVPELLGPITASQAGDRVLQYLDNPEQLNAIQQALRQVRGAPGAADRLAQLVLHTVTGKSSADTRHAHSPAVDGRR